MGQWRTLERAKDNRSSWKQRGPPGNTPWGTGRAEKLQTEVRGPARKLTSTPDPNGDTKPSFRSRTNDPRPRRGDPIVRLGTLMEKRTHWNKENKSLMEGKGQARSLGISRPNRLCAHNHRYSKVAHRSHLTKQQRKAGEDRVLASTVTSQVKAWSLATRSHDKPKEDVGKRRHHF